MSFYTLLEKRGDNVKSYKNGKIIGVTIQFIKSNYSSVNYFYLQQEEGIGKICSV